ncbi:hypothetical protein [Paenisporosarcina cavernae]|uniref:hypothetical protein n=1 Tax=Paenisporosarcina cavernae TaxID=2320858 RepID=UPI0013C43B51|nr:hypothetical protein [Paenisporosarcina cavernae]
MKIWIHILVIGACLVATYFLYNKQVGAVPLLILAIYLFFFSVMKMRQAKNSK